MPRYLVPNFEQPDWQAGAMPCAVDKGSASPGLIQGLTPPCELPDHFAPSCLTTDAICSLLTPSVPSRACLVPEVFADGRRSSHKPSVQLCSCAVVQSIFHGQFRGTSGSENSQVEQEDGGELWVSYVHLPRPPPIVLHHCYLQVLLRGASRVLTGAEVNTAS